MGIAKMTVLLAVVCGLLTGWPVDAGQDTPASPPAQREEMVDVGGVSLFFSWIPGNRPAVLLEAGGGMDSTEWDEIAPRVARRTGATVIRYDRAGFGRSDLPDAPCRMDVEARWLHTGLQKLGLEQSLVLVGHSYGGWMIRLFASLYPDPVRGMVFVDPFSVEFVDLLGVDYLDNHPMAGKLPFDTSDPDKLTRLQKALVRMVSGGLGPKVDIMRKTTLPAGIPIRLISSRIRFMPKMAEQQAWWKAHRQIAAKNRDIILVEAAKSHHMVPVTEPDLIIRQIEAVLQLTRK